MSVNSRAKTKKTTNINNRSKGYTVTAQLIDHIISDYTTYTVDQLKQALQDCQKSVKRMQKQLEDSPTTLPSTEKALMHWRKRVNELDKCITLRVQKDIKPNVNQTQSTVIKPSEETNTTNDLVEVFIPRTNNAWSRAFVEAACDLLPPKVFGKIYQLVPKYLVGTRPEYYLDRKDLLGNM